MGWAHAQSFGSIPFPVDHCSAGSTFSYWARFLGALVFIPYTEVEKFVNLYRTQEDYVAAQDITYEALNSAAGIITSQKQVSDYAAAYYLGISQGEYETALTRLMTVLASLSSQLNKPSGWTASMGNCSGAEQG